MVNGSKPLSVPFHKPSAIMFSFSPTDHVMSSHLILYIIAASSNKQITEYIEDKNYLHQLQSSGTYCFLNRFSAFEHFPTIPTSEKRFRTTTNKRIQRESVVFFGRQTTTSSFISLKNNLLLIFFNLLQVLFLKKTTFSSFFHLL